MPPESFPLDPRKTTPKPPLLKDPCKRAESGLCPPTAPSRRLDTFFHVSYDDQTMKNTVGIKIDFPPQATGHRPQATGHRPQATKNYGAEFGFVKYVAPNLSLISDKITPYSNEGKDHPLGYSRRMKHTMKTKELARLGVIKGALDGVYTVKLAARPPRNVRTDDDCRRDCQNRIGRNRRQFRRGPPNRGRKP